LLADHAGHRRAITSPQASYTMSYTMSAELD
jgi:hypothetical protein